MKKFTLILSTLLVSGTVLAGGHGYTVKKQTVSCSNGAECRIEHISDNYDVVEKKNLMAPEMVQAETTTSDKNGILNKDVEVDSYHKIKIVNRDSYTRSYEYLYTLECADLKLTSITVIDIKPGGVYTSSDRSVGVVKKAVLGNNKITAWTKAYHLAAVEGRQATATLTIRNK